MTTKRALAIPDAYLNDEGAQGLEEVLVRTGPDTVELFVHGREFVISLDFEDVGAIQQLVNESQELKHELRKAITPWKPDWSQINPIFRYLTKRDGLVRAHTNRPILGHGDWDEIGFSETLHHITIPAQIDWKIVHVRPE